MTEGNSQSIAGLRRQGWHPAPALWALGAGLIAMVVLMPLASVVWNALHPTENNCPHLISTTLPR